MKIIAVIYATFAVVKRKPEKTTTTTTKNSGLYGIRTLDLCDTGSALYLLRKQASWEQVRYKPVKGW